CICLNIQSSRHCLIKLKMLIYDFSSGLLRLWIQCDENTFLDVVCCRALLSIEGTALACTCKNGDIFF
ncbi:unnamed protein product, partial [Brassica napus]